MLGRFDRDEASIRSGYVGYAPQKRKQDQGIGLGFCWAATRYDKLAANDLAFIQLASIRLWLGVNETAP
jgi:hypothetical protein